MGGIGAPFEFKGSAGDGKMRGLFILDMEGQKMELPTTGAKTE